MALSATTEKPRLYNSTSSSKVICSQAVGAQFLGRSSKVLSRNLKHLSKLCAPLQNRQNRGLTCLLEHLATGLRAG